MLDTLHSEIIIEFPGNNISFNFSTIVDLSLEMTSNFKYYFGFVVGEILNLGIL